MASQLEQDWPVTLSEWDASQCEDGFCFEPFGDPCPERLSLNQAAVMESASAVQVAHIANLPNILSSAYYQLSRISSVDVLWRDTVLQLGPVDECGRDMGRSRRNHRCGKLGKRRLLSKEDLRRLALGKEKLSRHMLSFKKRLPKELVLHLQCANAWNTSIPAESVDVLTDLLELCSAEMFPDRNICSDCRSKINERGMKERERVWDLLPKFFCLRVRSGTS